MFSPDQVNWEALRETQEKLAGSEAQLAALQDALQTAATEGVEAQEKLARSEAQLASLEVNP